VFGKRKQNHDFRIVELSSHTFAFLLFEWIISEWKKVISWSCVAIVMVHQSRTMRYNLVNATWVSNNKECDAMRALHLAWKQTWLLTFFILKPQLYPCIMQLMLFFDWWQWTRCYHINKLKFKRTFEWIFLSVYSLKCDDLQVSKINTKDGNLLNIF